MFQTDQSTAASSLPTPAGAGTPGFFTGGNPASGTPATVVDPDWLNMIQQELINIVDAGGETPSKTTYNQVLLAIKRLVQNQAVLADTGAVNAYAAVNTPPLVTATWANGTTQQIVVAHTSTGASTYSPDGLTAIPIYGLGLQPLQQGEMFAGGTAILMKQTIAGVNSGNPICVLMECAGGAQQVALAAQPLHAMQFGQLTGAVGSRTNLKASCVANATSIAFTADQITVGTALYGLQYLLPSFNKTLNLGSTGAGGMDTGTATAGGWLAVYAICNPQAAVFNGSISGATLTVSSVASGALAVGQTVQGAAPGTTITALGTGTGGTGTYTVSISQTLAGVSLVAIASALLGTLEVSAAAPTIYGGANMPAGYTASALLAVIRVSGTAGQLNACLVNGRRISIQQLLTLQTSTTVGVATSFSLSGAVPKAAVRVSGETQLVSTSASLIGMSLSSDSLSNIGYQNVSASGSVSLTGNWAMDILTTQTLYYSFTNSAGTPTMSLYVSAYEI